MKAGSLWTRSGGSETSSGNQQRLMCHNDKAGCGGSGVFHYNQLLLRPPTQTTAFASRVHLCVFVSEDGGEAGLRTD